MLMWRPFSLALAVTLCCAGAALGETNAPAHTNLVVNGGFEQGGAGWQFLLTGANATGQVDGAERHEGKYYKLTNKTGQAPNIYARITQGVTGLRPYTTYKELAGPRARVAASTGSAAGRAVHPARHFPTAILIGRSSPLRSPQTPHRITTS